MGLWPMTAELSWLSLQGAPSGAPRPEPATALQVFAQGLAVGGRWGGGGQSRQLSRNPPYLEDFD